MYLKQELMDHKQAQEGLEAELPHYAQPRFVRMLASPDAIQHTLTFKPKKAELQKEGFAPSESGPVYVRDPAARSYRLLDDAARRALDAGELPL